MNDMIPLWFAVPAIVAAWIGVIVLAVRDSIRYYESIRAQDPVVVTGSGARRDTRPYACETVGGVR